ncbi:MAG: hypothetical protein AAGA30_04745 [Planctomycetota bacterium]
MTRCSALETLRTTFMLICFVSVEVAFGQAQDPSNEESEKESVVSVLELNDDSDQPSNLLSSDAQYGVSEIQKMWGSTDATLEGELLQDQTQSVLDSVANEFDAGEPEILLRGPLHEAFAETHQADPQPNPIVDATPPEAINEVPPEFKPEGSNVQWIPGYWAWDNAQDDFIWISGIWRDVPSNRRWVPGYWEPVESGHRWVAGLWAGLEQQDLNYLPTPPPSIDQGPSVASPSADYFYCPGNWEYRNNRYVWRTGHWQPRVANWIWIPAKYIWTPRGCIYRPGYWDREFDVRGTLFAPVHFRQPNFLATGFSFQPNYCINTGADFFVHLFIRPSCNHYFFGNWYGPNFVNTGFRPWINPRSHYRSYDPLFAHYNCPRFQYGNQLLVNWVSIQHRHYHRNRNFRPQNTLQAQINFVQSTRNQRHHDFIKRANLADRYDDIVRGRVAAEKARRKSHRNHSNQRIGNPNLKRNYVRTNQVDRHRHRVNELAQREIKNARRAGEKRKSSNSSNSDKRLAHQKQTKKPNQARKRANQVVNQSDKKGGINRGIAKQGPPARGRDIVRANKVALPQTRIPKSANRIDLAQSNESTRGQIAKAEREQAKAIRKRELAQKVNAAKQQAEIEREQREVARNLSRQQRLQRATQNKQKLEREKQQRLANRNLNPSQTKNLADSVNRSNQVKRNNLTPTKNQNRPLATQKAVEAQRQRERQKRASAELVKRTADIKNSQTSDSSQQRKLQRQREQAVKAQAAAQKRTELQAKITSGKLQRDAERVAAQRRIQQKAQADAQRRAREKSQRDAERRAAQKRTQQKAQADAQRRALEKSQRDAQRNAANQARRAAEAARKRQREREQAARRAQRKKK